MDWDVPDKGGEYRGHETRRKLRDELIATERTYLDGLEVLCDAYLPGQGLVAYYHCNHQGGIPPPIHTPLPPPYLPSRNVQPSSRCMARRRSLGRR